jgi:DNA (cytosine-5)-methyltransferase 1
MTKFRLGELFCGPGGIAYGAAQARIPDTSYAIVHQWATDRDADSCQTYSRNICNGELDSVVCADIRQLDMEKSLGQRGGIDALAFGFPCNDYSIVGEKKGLSGEFGPLYAFGIKALKLFRPRWFFAENVGGLQTANSGEAFRRILDEMREARYIVTPHLYKFELYGVPQARHRVIIVGIREDERAVYRVPSTKPFAHIDNSSRSAIENPPIAPDAPNHERTKQTDAVIRRLSHILPGQNAFTADLPSELKIKTSTKISQIYKRLDPDKPAYTVTGSGGGGTHMYHWSEPRALTNRERARLQTFPDTFIFHGSKESVRRQIGMAVPCEGARIIFEAILKSFAGMYYECAEGNVGG